MPRTIVVFTVAALFTASLAAQAPTTYKLGKIAATGVHRFTIADVVKVSGLSIGQTVAVSDIDAAAATMASMGLFKAVRYRFTTQAGQLTVMFEIDEQTDWSVPVVYDNFISIADDELSTAVRNAVPAFDGKAPVSSHVPDLIATALKGVLARHALPGDIDYKPSQRLGGEDLRHVFSVVNPAPKTCALHIDGAAKVTEADLLEFARDIVGAPYSRRYLSDYARLTLIQPYQRRGFWRAAFQTPVATPGEAAGCTGALVTIHVDEGIAYNWHHAEWLGNAVMDAGRLGGLIGLKAGDLAESLRVEDGLRAINSAYGRQGYLQQRADSVPVLDDAEKRATFRISIVEGPQFHMGAFSVAGLPQKDADALATKWKLKPGDVYDAGYPDEFQSKEVARLSTAARPLAVQSRINAQARVVDVVVTVRQGR